VTTIYLLRHGALAADSARHFVGQIDLPLAVEGVRQARALARALGACAIDAIYCSDLLRARQTAEIIARKTHAPVEVAHELREIALGDWEGLSRREIAERFPAEFAARGRDFENYRPPGGESFATCRQRALAAWEEIIHCGSERLVVVGHAGVNRLLLCDLLGMPSAKLFHLGQDYGCVNIVEIDGDRRCLSLMNGRAADLHTAISR